MITSVIQERRDYHEKKPRHMGCGFNSLGSGLPGAAAGGNRSDRRFRAAGHKCRGGTISPVQFGGAGAISHQCAGGSEHRGQPRPNRTHQRWGRFLDRYDSAAGPGISINWASLPPSAPAYHTSRPPGSVSSQPVRWPSCLCPTATAPSSGAVPGLGPGN